MNLAINVCTYPITDPRFGRALNRIYLMAEEIDSTDKLYENYSFNGLKVNEWVGVSIYEDMSANLCGFASINKRQDIWGNGVRILNRFMKIHHYRFENDKRKVSDATKKMISQQLEVAKELGYDFAFMSRESNSRTNCFKHYHKDPFFKNWKLAPHRYQMFYMDHDAMIDNFVPSCWQHISWTPLNDSIKNINIEYITEDDFNALRKS